MRGDGDGWSAGPGGRKLWGLFGAAGLFLVAETAAGPRLLLQHRAHWTADGGLWGIPGGAKDSHETASVAAVRETVEETAIDATEVRTLAEIVTAGPMPADASRPHLPGGWTYTTVLATCPRELETTANEESLDLRWVPLDQLEDFALLPAFAAALPEILEAYAAVSG